VGGAAHAVRAGDQPQDRPGPRCHHPPGRPFSGERGDSLSLSQVHENRPLNRHYRPRAVARLKTVRKANIKITVRLPMVQKFLDGRAQGESLWLFLDVQGVEATHNIAERAHRFGVLWRQRSQGTRSEKGNRWVERVLSLRHTCRIRGHPTFPMLVEAVSCLFKGEVVFQMCTLPLYRLC
jgi:hypothetical protein